MSDIRTRIVYEGAAEGAQQLERLTGEVRQLGSASEQAAAATRALESAQKSATQASKAKARGMAEAVNMASEMSLGFGGLSPQVRELSIALAMGGNNAVVMANSMGPLGVVLGVVTGLVPTLITQFVGARGAGDELASTMQRLSSDADRSAESIRDLIEEMRRLEEREQQIAGLAEIGDIARSEQDQRLARRAAQRDLGQLENRFQELFGAGAELPSAEEARRRIREGGALSGNTLEVLRATIAARERLAAVDAELNLLGQGRSIATETEALAARGQAGFDELLGNTPDAARRRRQFEDRRRERQDDGRLRRGGGSRRRADDGSRELSALGANILGDSDEARERVRMEEQAAEEIARVRRELADFTAELNERSIERQLEQQERLAERRLEDAERLKEKERELAEEAERAADRRLEQMREVTSRIGDSLQTVAGAFSDAFGKAIEGQMSLEEAAAAASKVVLKGLGDQMVQIGIREMLEGFANIVSAPPVAATKIPMGLALIGAGAGLGAAGAAIPSGPSGAAAERPRADQERPSGEPMTVVLNYNSPIISTGTQAQLSRQLQRQVRDGLQIPSRLER